MFWGPGLVGEQFSLKWFVSRHHLIWIKMRIKNCLPFADDVIASKCIDDFNQLSDEHTKLRSIC